MGFKYFTAFSVTLLLLLGTGIAAGNTTLNDFHYKMCTWENYRCKQWNVAELLSRIAAGNTTLNDYHYKMCSWDKSRCMWLNVIELVASGVDTTSHWPKGPYALLTPQEGCPESVKKGWRRGYISFTWKEPHTLMSLTSCDINSKSNQSLEEKEGTGPNAYDEDTCMKYLIPDLWPEIQSSLLGPFSRHAIRFNFCFMAGNKTHAVGTNIWPNGSYSVFGGEKECPSGFVSSVREIKLPAASSWTSYGFLPDFTVKTDEADNSIVLTLKTCDRQTDNSVPNEVNYQRYFSSDSFIFLKSDPNISCPQLSATSVAIEGLKLQAESNNDMNLLDIFTFCYYRPNNWLTGLDTYKYIPTDALPYDYETAFRISNPTFTYGTKTISMGNSLNKEFLTQTLDYRNITNPWLLLDLGRNLIVVGIQFKNFLLAEVDSKEYKGSLNTTYYGNKCQRWDKQYPHEHVYTKDNQFPDETVSDAENYCRDPSQANEIWCYTEDIYSRWQFCARTVYKFQEEDMPYSKCFISYDKWRNDEFGAISCIYTVHYGSPYFYDTPVLYYRFQKQLEGRYVTLVGHAGTEIARFNSLVENVEVLTSAKMLYEDSMCNEDLGMGDESVHDFQITASTWLPQSPPYYGRPFFPGWCSETSDKTPFITVDMMKDTKIEGITFFNWERTVKDVTKGVYQKRYNAVGCKKSMVSFSTELNIGNSSAYINKTFKVDMFLPIEQPQTFIHEPVVARYITVYILESMIEDEKCLRFELHGCRHDCYNRISLPELIAVGWESITFSNLQTLNSPSVLSSIDFPLHYPGGTSYTWIIDFQEGGFIRIIFSNTSLNVYDKDIFGHCTDKLRLLHDVFTWAPMYIDQQFNDLVILIDTDVNYMSLTFTACRPTSKITEAGDGFKAIINKQAIPTCFSLSSIKETKVQNMCSQPTMYITSLSRLNILDSLVPEEWIIHVNRFSFYLEFIFFNVRCDTGSLLRITDRFSGEKALCNLRMVSPKMYPDSLRIHIRFEKEQNGITEDYHRKTAKDGFKAVYGTFENSMTHLIDSEETNEKTIRKLAQHERDYIAYRIEDSILKTQGNAQLSVQRSKLPPITVYLKTPFSDGYKCIINENLNPSHLSCVIISVTLWTNATLMSYKGSPARPPYKSIIHMIDTCSKKFGKCYFIYSGRPMSWKTAGDECWIRKSRLVSIHTDEEHELIKYMLRNFRYIDDTLKTAFSSDRVGPNYFTHIGLSSVASEAGRRVHLWEDGSPVTFSAWNVNDTMSDGDCTRMSFHLFNTNTTWEPEMCDSGLASYSICEQVLTPELLKVSVQSNVYNGTLNVTINGIPCQRWDSQDPHRHSYSTADKFPDKDVNDAQNFCRDPSGAESLWCYTVDPDIRWDLCKEQAKTNKFIPRFYTGRLSTTSSGRTCQRWDSQTPHEHNYRQVSYFPDASLEDIANHCRDPALEGILWCYTTDPFTRWDICSFPDTASDRCYSTRSMYAGKWNSTISGRNCQAWESQSPHDHELFLDSQFPDGSVSNAMNFCRDPYNEGYLWCFTMDPATKSEPCVSEYENEISDNTDEKVSSQRTFKCGNGDIIPREYLCDGTPSCLDLTDETNCTDKVHGLMRNRTVPNVIPAMNDTNSLFQCESMEWISTLARCDSVIDCIDATDEVNCSSSQVAPSCSKEEYTCDGGGCIHISQMCDFVADCTDASDENCNYPLCSSTEYRCRNQQCIPEEKRCDAYIHCLDGTDEIDCDVCTNTTFHCDLMRCIPRRLVCDRYADCRDGSDETQCNKPIRYSCEEWWIAGYRKSGLYKLNDTEVECNFKYDQKDVTIYTIFHNFEITTRNGVEMIHSTERELSEEPFISTVNKFFRNNTYVCFQNITQSCVPAHKAAADSEDPHHENAYRHCDCMVMTVRPGDYDKHFTDVYYCDSDELVADEDILLFHYHESESRRNITLKHNLPTGVEVTLGPAVCYFENKFDEIDIGCEDENVFPVTVRCIYDIDRAGFILGCRSGQHLQGCETFQCPNNTVKCPGSFCLPLKFICDGERQCPGGQDEQDCGCEDDDREVILLFEDSNSFEENKKLRSIATQFYTANSIVRELRYRVRTLPEKLAFDHRMLDISDTEIHPYSTIDRQFVCNYSILASDLINNIEFSKKKVRGIIYFQTRHVTDALSKMIFGNIKSQPEFLMYSVMQDTNSSDTESYSFPFLKNVFLKQRSALATIGAMFFPDLCTEAAKSYCPHDYMCAASKTCIPLDQVCDGHVQCVFDDDEKFCDYYCPDNCSCLEYTTDCSFANIDNNSLLSLHHTSRLLDLSGNPRLQSLLLTSTWQFPYLISLNLSNCGIDEMSKNNFQTLVNLRILDLSFNRFRAIPGFAFIGLRKLRQLNLFGNKEVYRLDPFALNGLLNIRIFEIKGAIISKLSANAFADLDLNELNLMNNEIMEIEDGVFSQLKVKVVDIKSNKISSFDKGVFQGVYGMTTLLAPAFKYCCVRPGYLAEENCSPKKDEFSSCDDLLRLSTLQTMFWLIGILAVFGNILSVVYRLFYDRERLKIGYGIFVTNLAVADFFMGIYLIIVAIADVAFRKRYMFMDEFWRNSAWCAVAGFLSTVSSEASVFFLCLITIDRFLVIRYPFGQVRFKTKTSGIACLVSWSVALSIGLIPILYSGYFHGRFYSKTGICIALPLTRDRPPGWLYSIIVFIGLNFVTFCLIAIGQVIIYLEIKKATSVMRQVTSKSRSSRQKELTVARNLLLVVATDFVCWFPIGCMGIMAMSGIIIPADIYAWTAVLILPVNSALNPVLYTLTTILGKKKSTRKDENISSTVHTTRILKQFRPSDGLFHYFMTRNDNIGQTLIRLHDLPINGIKMKTSDVVLISFHLIQSIRLLHKHSLVMSELDGSVVYAVVQNDKVIADIHLTSEPTVSYDTCKHQENIFQLGQVIQGLLAKRND